MAELNFFDTYVLMAIAEEIVPQQTFFRDRYFPTGERDIFACDKVLTEYRKGDRKMAAFVSARAGDIPMDRIGYAIHEYQPAFIAPSRLLTLDDLPKRGFGEAIYANSTPAQRAARLQLDDLTDMDRRIVRREEWMCVQAIVTGQIPIVGPGVNEVIDFGFTNKIKLDGTKQWGKTAAKPIEDLEDWTEKGLTGGFTNVDRVIMGKAALRAFVNDEKVQKLLDNRRINIGGYDPRDLPNGVKYYGHLTSPNIDLYTYGEVYLDDWTDPETPAVKPLVPENVVILISGQSNFMLAYGACTYIEDSTQQWVTAETSRLLRSYVEHHPDRRMVELQAHPLPIPDKVDSWLVAEVC